MVAQFSTGILAHFSISIYSEKPLVAKRLARILGADKMEDGYLIGNGYAVT